MGFLRSWTFLFMILTIVLFVGSIAVESLAEKKIIKVDCFDREGNKINKLTCDEEVYIDESLEFLLILLSVLAGISMVVTFGCAITAT